MEQQIALETVLILTALARFDLEMANVLSQPFNWQIDLRRNLQSQAAALLAEVRDR